jgi:hypothetical protein
MLIIRSKTGLSKVFRVVILALLIFTILFSSYFIYQHFQQPLTPDSLTDDPDKLTPKITLYINSSTPNLSENIKIIANFSEPFSGNVVLQWSIGSSDFIYETNETVKNGFFTRDFNFAQPGHWRFRVYWQGDLSYNSVCSEIISIQVIP